MPMNSRDLSLSPFIFWPEAERPINWRQQFGRESILEVEIGFGYGEFLVQLAQKYPARNFVGLELRWASIRKALRNIAQNDTQNIASSPMPFSYCSIVASWAAERPT